ncbi:hypothetical protein ACLOJK_024466 [Asimina triloba]
MEYILDQNREEQRISKCKGVENKSCRLLCRRIIIITGASRSRGKTKEIDVPSDQLHGGKVKGYLTVAAPGRKTLNFQNRDWSTNSVFIKRTDSVEGTSKEKKEFTWMLEHVCRAMQITVCLLANSRE